MATIRKSARIRGTGPLQDSKNVGSKVKSTLLTGDLVWEWENDKGVWTRYKSEHSTELTKALSQGKESVILQVTPAVSMNVRFSVMTQTNTSTSWQRNVRCAASRSSRWEWQDENEKWNAYSPTIQQLLVACELCGRNQLEIEAAGRKYCVDLLKNNQVNLETGVERKVRQKADSETADCTPSTSSGLSSNGTSRPKRAKKVVEKEIHKSTASVSCSAEEEEGRVVIATVGTVPVDYACSQKAGKAHVYCEGKEYWDAMLNQTNLKNNNNKFYILQLLQDDGLRTQYSVWFRWGRVGKTGQNSLQSSGSDLEKAKDIFSKKFCDKTGNVWEDRHCFVKHPGKYDLLLIDYESKDEADGGCVDGEQEEEEDRGSLEAKKPVESKLDLRVQSLIQLICNVNAMEEMVIEMKYDAKRVPLGKLTKEQITSGYAALKKIEDCINKNDFGDRHCKACDEFYTRIPHNFGMKRLPLIRTRQEVKDKITLLEALGDIQIAMKILGSGGGKGGENEHVFDRHYRELKCELSSINLEVDKFHLVEKYMRQTHAKTHSQYTLQLIDLFEVERDQEKEDFKDVGNRKLLWHGSRLTNWVGILCEGLRIAPPEAPVTGYMFGKGIYFADICSKSANYCFASKARNEGLILLCEVALGHTNDLLAADYNADQLPKGKHSVLGLGRVAPDTSMEKKLPDGCIVPLGTNVDTGVHNPRGYTLNYNEYVVYDTRQVRMKYLARVKFNFK